MTVLADLYAQPWDREAPRRASWALTPAWYFYLAGRSAGLRIAAEVDERCLSSDADDTLRRLVRRAAEEAWRTEGYDLGRLWACLLGDL